MLVMSERDEEIYTKLVKLAGGNSSLVMELLSRPIGQRPKDLSEAVTMIVAARTDVPADIKRTIAERNKSSLRDPSPR